jgi:hypothetical protein
LNAPALEQRREIPEIQSVPKAETLSLIEPNDELVGSLGLGRQTPAVDREKRAGRRRGEWGQMQTPMSR